MKAVRKSVAHRERLVTMRSVFRLITAHDFDFLAPGKALSDAELAEAWKLCGDQLRAKVRGIWGDEVRCWADWHFTAGVQDPHETEHCRMPDGGYVLRMIRSGEWELPAAGA